MAREAISALNNTEYKQIQIQTLLLATLNVYYFAGLFHEEVLFLTVVGLISAAGRA